MKTTPSDKSVSEFLDSIPDPQRQNDSLILLEMMQQITGYEPMMWGDSIIGFGNHHYKYESGREGDWFIVGFSPRKQNLTVYLWYGFDQQTELMKKLGKVKTGKACLYINKLEDINMSVLKELVSMAVAT